MGSGASIGRISTALTQLSQTVAKMKVEARERDESLGAVIASQQEKIAKLERKDATQKSELGTLRKRLSELERSERQDVRRGRKGRGGNRDDSSIKEMSEGQKSALRDNILEAVSRQYVANTLLPGLQVPTDLSRYVTHRELRQQNFVSTPQLDSRDFVNSTQLTQALPTPTVMPPRLGDRLAQLERELTLPGGSVDRLTSKLQDYMEAQRGAAVSAGPYTFRNAMDADTWIRALGVADPLQYCPDFRIQLGMMEGVMGTENEQLVAMANASKVGLASLDLAKVHLSFTNPYPESLFRSSTDVDATCTESRMFTPPFSSAKVYEGTIAYSTLTEKLRVLERNRDKFQASVDFTFPADQSKHAKTHAVFSHVLGKGYIQARSFLESFLPFYKMLMETGLSQKKAWQKVLTYATAVFKRVSEVRTVSSVVNDGVMLYGMLASTTLLDAFCDLDWIRHPDVSSALVLAALQRDGSGSEEVMTMVKKHLVQISTNQGNIAKLTADMVAIKKLNPSLKTS